MKSGIELAVSRATEGGFNEGKTIYPFLEDKTLKMSFEKACLLDPLFWQALGKAEGWEKPLGDKIWGVMTYDGSFGTLTRRWENETHNFIIHLTEGKSPDTFFETLLK